ncbi:IQ domain-containing protein [Zostera marina]|uniref:IQ domain-containing protein n=1 Tax=Zostera marina TaxID=29655 RepID=A0A0K9Q549_ZOSMR|nr:IQ domain-containing protein [Zostera marina]
MGKKGKFFCAVKRVLSPGSKEKKQSGKKNENMDSIDKFPGSTSQHVVAPSELPPPESVVNIGPVETVEHEEIEVTNPIETSNSGSDSADAEQTVLGTVTITESKFDGKPREEVAAIMIQTVYRGYQARRALRGLKGLVRLKTLMDGEAAKRQVTTTLRCMQTLSRVQSQVQSRRIRLTEEKQALQRLKREQELAALKASMGEEWDDSQQTKEKIDAGLMSKHEAAIRRERAMAYSFSHQRKNTLKSGYPLFTDLNNPHWEWSCMEHLTTLKALIDHTTISKEQSIEQTLAKNLNVGGGEITNSYARRVITSDINQKSTRSRHPNLATPIIPLVVMPKNSKHTIQKGGHSLLPESDDDSRSVLSVKPEPNRRHTITGSVVKEDENILTSAQATPNFMTPTKSAKAKSRSVNQSPASENINDIQEKVGSLSKIKPTKKRFSPARRHSGPSKVNINSPKVAHSNPASEIIEAT